MSYNKIIIFHFLNLLCFLILYGWKPWDDDFYMLVLMEALVPNLIGFVMNAGLFVLLKDRLNKYYFILIFFLTNEIAWGFFEKRFILFGLIRPHLPPNIIQPDPNDFIIISLSSIIAGILVTIFPLKKMPYATAK